jgi:hypothetical protein
MIFIDAGEHFAVCRTYGAQESVCLRYPALTGRANLCRTSGAKKARRTTGKTLPHSPAPDKRGLIRSWFELGHRAKRFGI